MELTPTIKMLHDVTKRLDAGSKKVFELARGKAEAERIYRSALAQVIFRMRDEKIPIGIINDLARGEVADLKFERDLAAETYKASLSSLEALKVEVSAIQTIVRWQSEVDS